MQGTFVTKGIFYGSQCSDERPIKAECPVCLFAENKQKYKQKYMQKFILKYQENTNRNTIRNTNRNTNKNIIRNTNKKRV